jgi:gliding motility-associated-like protein
MKKFTTLYTLLLGVLISFFTSQTAFGTHMKGGEISVRRISQTSLTYEFTLTIYCENNIAWRSQETAIFCFGDGSASIEARRQNGVNGAGEDIGNGTMKGVYKATYTYATPGIYAVNVAIQNRNANVKNMSNSVDTGFYVETKFSIDPGLGLNNTPILLNPAVDLTAVVGQKYIHNPNAVDIEGDSLAYRLTYCRTGKQESCASRGASVENFRQPNDVSSIPSTFTIDARTGDLVWDVPQEIGLYNCAFIVEEWRNGVKISETTRDMQIEVKDADNKPPVIKVPDDICVEAGTLINKTITATDTPSKTGRIDALTITSTGAVYKTADVNLFIDPPYATFTSVAKQTASPATGVFTWQTGCSHIRQQTYDINFKAVDNPLSSLIPSLVDSKTWKIRVVAPRIKNLKAQGDAGNRITTLTWDSYACQNTGAVIVIYRKDGCTDFTPTACQLGLPSSLGYTEVGRVPVSATTFTDKNLKRNVEYSYRTVVQFTNNGTSTESVASDQACLTMKSTVPVITNVSIDKTSRTDGQITVKWTRPIGLDKSVFKGPYQYRLSRAAGASSTTFTQVGSVINTDLLTGADTILVDKNLNTEATVYRYRLAFYYTSNTGLTALDSTDIANSVRLTATTGKRSINLSWQADVPWKNENQKHRIYRETKAGSGIFNRIAEVTVQAGSFTYTDNGKDTYAADGTINAGMIPDSSYCYKVETVGTYNDPKIKPDLLYNFSQVTCASPSTDAVPCAVALTIDPLDCTVYTKDEGNCNQSSFSNVLTWTYPKASNCDSTIVKYTVYYSGTKDGNFTKIGEVTSPIPPATTFTHTKTDSFLGCYYVTATSKYDVEGPKSNTVCKDNCPSYLLPNIFTPNGDGRNDTFQAMNCPRFVKDVLFMVYNRSGQKVYEYSGAKLEWDGTNQTGNSLPSDTYYYTCNVNFVTLDPTPPLNLKGWIELVR